MGFVVDLYEAGGPAKAPVGSIKTLQENRAFLNKVQKRASEGAAFQTRRSERRSSNPGSPSAADPPGSNYSNCGAKAKIASSGLLSSRHIIIIIDKRPNASNASHCSAKNSSSTPGGVSEEFGAADITKQDRSSMAGLSIKIL